MEYASSSSGSGDRADGMVELSATIKCRLGEDADAPIQCFQELRQGSGAAVSTLEINDPTYNEAAKKYLQRLEVLEKRRLRKLKPKRSVDESRTTPVLHEHVVRHIAQYVKFSGGIKGLLSFRLVSRMWNEIGTGLLNKENLKLELSQRKPRELELLWRGEKDRPVRDFVQLKKSASGVTVSFTTISIRHIEEEREDVMKLFLQPSQPWTTEVRLLYISGFSVVEYNEIVGRILATFPYLESLELGVEENPKDFYDGDFHLQPPHHWWEDELAREAAQSQTLKRFGIRFYRINDRNHGHFNWNFVESCPRLEWLSLPHFHPQLNLTELLRMIPKLKTLEIKSLVHSWNINDRANFVNHVCPANLRVCFNDPSVMTTFFENIVDVSGQVAELYLEFLVDGYGYNSQPGLLEVPIITPQFKVLRVLHFRVNAIIEWGNCFALGTIETLIDFSIITDHDVTEYEKRKGIRSFVRKMSQCFPNLQIFYGDVVDKIEIKLLLVELAKLPKLRKLTIFDKEWDVRYEVGVRDGYYQGLRSLSSLVELILRAKNSIGKDVINVIADEMIGLKRLTLEMKVTTEVREYAIEKLVKGRRMNVTM